MQKIVSPKNFGLTSGMHSSLELLACRQSVGGFSRTMGVPDSYMCIMLLGRNVFHFSRDVCIVYMLLPYNLIMSDF